jgi:hypothetical protein
MSKAKTRDVKTPTSKTEQWSTSHAETLPNPETQSDPVGPSPMMLAYVEWQQARAALHQADVDTAASPRDSEQPLIDAMKRVDASEWKIIQACAHDTLDVRVRAMALQQVFLDAEMSGEPTDNRHLMMLSALIHDVLNPRFGWRAE